MKKLGFVILVLAMLMNGWPSPSRAQDSDVEIRIWWPDVLAPLDARQILDDEFETVRERNDILLEVRRRVYTEGDIARQLTLTRNVAPAALPDLVLMRRTDVVEAARRSLLVPLENWLPTQILDMPENHLALGSVDGQLYGLPYLMEVEHGLFYPEPSAEYPSTLDSLLEQQTPLLFPGAAPEGGVLNSLLLLQYISGGGRFSDDDGTPSLDEGIVRDLLDFYAEAIDDGLISECGLENSDCVLSYDSARDYWSEIPTDEPIMALINSRLYLQRRATRFTDMSIGVLPTLEGRQTALINGWMWVLVATDPADQIEAQRFIDLMYNSDTMATIAQSLYLLPSQQSARRVMGDEDYLEFLGDLLEDGIFVSDEDRRSVAALALQTAFESILQGTSADDATDNALASLAEG